jgi:hypothetical protein
VPLDKPDIPLTGRTPQASRPPSRDVEPLLSLEDIGRDDVRARQAPDGTRWCVCCDTTSKQGRTGAFCSAHYKARSAKLKTLRREEQAAAVAAAAATAAAAAQQAPAPIPDGMVLVDRNALVHVARMATMMSAHVARASRDYRDLNEPAWLDNLMLSAKNLDAAIQDGITNGTVLPATSVPRMRPDQGAPRR